MMGKSLSLSAVLMFLLPTLAQAQWVKVVVPYAPGGNIDVIGRIYAKKISELLKESWIVENISGGSGTIGTYSVAKSAPDGKTLMFAADAHSTARLVVKNVPYDPLGDFVAIARVAESPLVFIVNPAQVRARDLAELATDIKVDPKRYSFAISALGSLPHLAAVAFCARVDADVLIVPYRGTGPAVNDVASGQVNMMLVSPLAVMQLVRVGRLRALAVAAPRRIAGAPDVPTTEEAGMADFLSRTRTAFGDRRDLPKSPDLRQRLLDLGVTSIWETPEAFSRYASKELERNRRILEKAGVKPE